jgi:hypothetical protein
MDDPRDLADVIYGPKKFHPRMSIGPVVVRRCDVRTEDRRFLMRFQILIYNNPEFDAGFRGDLRDEVDRTHAAVISELKASGELIETNELSTEAAVVVRTDSHKRVHTTDGPFIEAKEWVGGFYLVDCASIDRAVDIAGRFVEARYSPVEVRQLVHEPS